MPMSAEAYAGPRRMLREPASPGNVNAILLNASGSFLKIFGTPNWPFKTKLVPIEPVHVPEEVRKKFVGKLKPLPGPNGNPECHRIAPVYAQPPIIASTTRFAEPASLRPRPTGRSMTQ